MTFIKTKDEGDTAINILAKDIINKVAKKWKRTKFNV